MNIYVGNLALNVTEGDLQQAFEAFGEVTSAKIIKDKYSGESKGFGFVEMPAGAEAQSAINGMNEKELKGRALKVNEARPQKNRDIRSSPSWLGSPEDVLPTQPLCGLGRLRDEQSALTCDTNAGCVVLRLGARGLAYARRFEYF